MKPEEIFAALGAFHSLPEDSRGDAPVYAPNSFGGPVASADVAGEGGWETDGDLVRMAYTLRAEDSDFGQAGTLYRDVFTAEAKARFLETLSGQAHAISIDEIRERFFAYWTNVDAGLGVALREAYAAGINADAPQQPEAGEVDEADEADAAA